MYRRPELYDAIYSFKDYEKEADQIREIIEQHGVRSGTLLDVACGTGKHIFHLKKHFTCEGLDLSGPLLEAARKRNPECHFMEADMRLFNMGRWFDAVICLFSAIGYVKTFEALEATLNHFALHTTPGGVVIVEPWLFPDVFQGGRLSYDYVDLPDYKVARMNLSEKVGDLSVLNFHFMVGCPNQIETWTERSELGLFTRAEYQVAMERSGLEVTFKEEGFMGRGLFIGKKGR